MRAILIFMITFLYCNSITINASSLKTKALDPSKKHLSHTNFNLFLRSFDSKRAKRYGK